MGFDGFPPKVRYTPVPNALFGPLLEQIDDLAELKCTLRLVRLLYEKRGFPRYVTFRELLTDRVLASALGARGKDSESEIKRGLRLAVRRGTFRSAAVKQGGTLDRAYVLNTESDRRALAELANAEPEASEAPLAEPWQGSAQRPNIFALYEDNIGMISPMIAEKLKEAEDLYPPGWIEDAFREAVSSNARSWRYVAAILERWEREGRDDGRPGRHPQKAGYERYLGR